MRRMMVMTFMFMLVITAGDAAASKSGDIRAGQQSYTQGDYDAAITHYERALQKDPESDVINYDLGTAYYKTENYPQAINHLQKSLLTDNPALRERAHYNLGNSFFKSGQFKEQSGVNSAVSSLEQAVSQYENALKLDQKDQDAHYNLDLAKRELERLKQKQQQQKKEQEKQKNQNQKDQKEKDQDKEEQQKQNQPAKPDQQNQPNPQNKDQPEQKQSGQGNQEKKEPAEPQDNAGEGQSETENKEKSSGDSKGNDRIETLPQEAQSSDESKGEGAVSGDMSQKEAEQLLNSYQQGEEPKGLLKFMKGKRKEAPVLKDW